MSCSSNWFESQALRAEAFLARMPKVRTDDMGGTLLFESATRKGDDCDFRVAKESSDAFGTLAEPESISIARSLAIIGAIRPPQMCACVKVHAGAKVQSIRCKTVCGLGKLNGSYWKRCRHDKASDTSGENHADLNVRCPAILTLFVEHV